MSSSDSVPLIAESWGKPSATLCADLQSVKAQAEAIEAESLEARRQAVEQIKGEILGLLGQIVEGTTRPPVVVHPAHGGPGGGIEAIHQAARDMAEQLKAGAVITLPGSSGWEVQYPTVDGEAFRRLFWLLGLSDAERGFVEAAATDATAGKPGEVFDGLAIFAEWLDEFGREKDGCTVRRLIPEDGSVIVLTIPDDAGALALSRVFDEIGKPLQAALAKLGRRVYVQAVRASVGVQPLDEQRMRELGWMSLNEHDSLFGGLSNELVGEPEDEMPSPTCNALTAMVQRLKRENAELRQAVREVKEDAAGICDRLADSGVDQYCCEPLLRGAAEEIRKRPPVG